MSISDDDSVAVPRVNKHRKRIKVVDSDSNSDDDTTLISKVK